MEPLLAPCPSSKIDLSTIVSGLHAAIPESSRTTPALSTLTVLTGIVFTDNARFFETFDLGFETKESIAIPLQNAGIYESMRHAAEQHPGITGVSGTRRMRTPVAL